MDFYQAKGIKTMEDLTDSLLSEQFLMTLSPELRQDLYSREPRCAVESAKYADLYFQSTCMSSESGNGHMSRGGLQHEAPNGNNGRARSSSGYPFTLRPQTSVPNHVPAMQGNGRPQGIQQFPRPGHPGPKFSGQQGARPNGGQKASQTVQHNQCYGCGGWT